MNPLTDTASKESMAFMGEIEVIESIRLWLEDVSPPSPMGIGDDAALLKTPLRTNAITTDSLVYKKHFTEEASPELVGAKLLKRSLSDLAAMGATPDYCVIACMLPGNLSVLWLEKFYKGLAMCAKEYQVRILGGDITSTLHDLAFNLTLTGYLTAQQTMTRKSAGHGDSVWVTGKLGGSILGKHLDFAPRIQEGVWLASLGPVSSGMDISDGLATDLNHLCPANAGITIDVDLLPVSNAAYELSSNTGQSPITHALSDGEDFELVFTLERGYPEQQFINQWQKRFQTQLTKIGVVSRLEHSETPSITFQNFPDQLKDLKGYEHFGKT